MRDHPATPAAEDLGTRLTTLGIYGIFAALTIVYFWFGGMKFTQFEAEGLQPLVGPSFVIGWMYDVFTVRGFSTFLGVLELAIALLIAGRLIRRNFRWSAAFCPAAYS